MPLYEYECPKDGRFERIQKFSDPPLTLCPTCGQPVKKLASAPAIQFKGSGWYITDYARKGGDASSKEGGAKEGAPKEGAGAKDSSPTTPAASASKDSSDSGSSHTK